MADITEGYDLTDVSAAVLEAAGLEDPDNLPAESEEKPAEEKAEEKPAETVPPEETTEKPDDEKSEEPAEKEEESVAEEAEPEADETPKDEIDELFPDPVDETEKGKAKWGDLKKELRSAKNQLTEAQTALEAAKSGVPSGETAETISTLTKELEAAKAQLFASDFTKSDEYAQEVQLPLTQALDDAKAVTSVVQSDEIEDPKAFANEVEAAMVAQNWGTLKRLIEPLDEMDTSLILQSFNEVKRLAKVHDRLSENSAAKAQEFEAAKTVEQQQKQAEMLVAEKSTKAEVRAKLIEKLPMLSDDKGELKPAIKVAMDEVDKTGLDEQALPVRAAGQYAVRILSHVVAEANKESISQKKEIAELKQAIEDAKGADPGAGAGKGGKEEAVEDDYSGWSDELLDAIANPDRALQ